MARGKKKETLTPEERLQAALVPASEQPYPVPENWCWTYLGCVSDVVTGGTPSKKHPEYYGGLFPFFKPTDLDFGRHVVEASEYLTNEGKIVSRIIPEQSTAVCCIGSIGKCGFLEVEGTTNQQINAAIPKFNPLFLYYYCNTHYFNEELWSKASATTISIVNKSKMESCVFPLPPLPEQLRIVDRIESLFAKLDEAKQKAQDALDSFETRKAAILHKAFTGELTAQWRKEHGVGMETWSSCKLIDILVEKPRNGYSPKPVDYVTACKSMTLSATTTGVFKPEFFKYIDEEIPENSHLWLTPGDILIQRANSLEKVGMSAIYTGAEHEFIYPDLMMKLTVKEPNNKHYIDYYLKTDEILNYFRSNATGTAGNMPKINQKVVSETPLILPETQEQAEIVRLLDDLLANEQQAKEAAEGVLEQIDLIKKAILARAFRGELGTNDPSEESAVELLKQVL